MSSLEELKNAQKACVVPPNYAEDAKAQQIRENSNKDINADANEDKQVCEPDNIEEVLDSKGLENLV